MKRDSIVVFIDDDLDYQKGPIIPAIEKQFIHVKFFSDSFKAIEFISKHIGNRLIVLLDIKFPQNEPNGHQVLEKIRKLSFLIPVIIFSALPEDQEPFRDFIENQIFSFLPKTSTNKSIVETLIRADDSSRNNVSGALEEWINAHPEEAQRKEHIIRAGGKKLSLKELLLEVRQQSGIGTEFSQRLTRLTIDLISRNKESL